MHERLNQGPRMVFPDTFDDFGRTRKGNTHSRFSEVDHGQPDKKRRGRNDLEIDQGFDPHPSDLAQFPAAGDPNHQSGKDERTDDRFDQIQKDIAQKIDCVPPLRFEPAKEDTGNQRHHDLRGERGPI